MSDESSDVLEIAGSRLSADFAVEYRWLTDGLAIGSMVGTRRNMRRLREAGISRVVDLQAECDDRALVGDTGIEVSYLPIANGLDVLPEAVLEEVVERAPGWLGEAGGKLFVHCLAGHHRAPTIGYALLRSLGWAPGDAEAHILAVDPRAQLAAADLRRIDWLVARRESSA